MLSRDTEEFDSDWATGNTVEIDQDVPSIQRVAFPGPGPHWYLCRGPREKGAPLTALRSDPEPQPASNHVHLLRNQLTFRK